MLRPIITLVTTFICAAALGLCCGIEQPADISKDTKAAREPKSAECQIPEDATSATDWAIADLADRLAVNLSEIEVVEMSRAEWRDSSLGCSAPGQMYAQVITPGYRILLGSDDGIWEYHSAQGSTTAVYCGLTTDKSEHCLSSSLL